MLFGFQKHCKSNFKELAVEKNELVQAGFIIRNLVNFCRWGGESLKEAPSILKKVVEKKLYLEFYMYGEGNPKRENNQCGLY